MTPRVRIGIAVPGADGSVLATDVVRPASAPRGAVVVRTPYGRGRHTAEGLHWADRGIAFVCQDVRGRHDSDGEWVPWRHERGDGAALLAWLRDRAWCPDRIVASGASYAAGTAWALAAEDRHGLVRGVVSKVPVLGSDRVKRDPGGPLRLAEHLAWWGEHGASRASRPGYVSQSLRSDPLLFEHLPVTDLAGRIGLPADDPGWAGPVRRAATGAPYGADDCVGERELGTLAVAGLHIGGWDDAMVGETLRHAATIGSAATAPQPQSLLVGPWGHRLTAPPAAGTVPLDPASAQVRWVDRVLDDSAPRWINLFDAGTGRWSSRCPAAAGSRRWVGDAAGVLEAHRKRHESQYTTLFFDYDPRRPGCGHLTWSSLPLGAPLRIWGTPALTVDTHCDTEADWVATLEIGVAGERTAIATGCRTTRVPGRIRIPLTAVHRTLPAGSRLVLTLAGADFPRLARNLGTGDRYAGTGTAVLRQQVRCGGTDPSPALDLPVLEPEPPCPSPPTCSSTPEPVC